MTGFMSQKHVDFMKDFMSGGIAGIISKTFAAPI
jgi:hypothetical protein